MESLLSLSFDYLSSHDAVKIRKGLRQLEGLLAQICLSATSLSSSPSSPEKKRHSTAFSSSNTKTQHPPKQLSQLVDDAAFREFFKLQEGFEWN
ncbi:hypothetical protein MMC25_000476, partial [Agyrium rufum]|nr:hypothetical protein [Agyrium rufum]